MHHPLTPVLSGPDSSGAFLDDTYVPPRRRRHSAARRGLASRLAVVVWGVVAYLAAIVTFVLFVAFLAGGILPRSVDGPVPTGSAPAALAAIVDLGLVLLFAGQHAALAPRAATGRPRRPPAADERSTAVLGTSLVLAALVCLWQPLPAAVWTVAEPAARAVLGFLFAAGAATVIVASLSLDHFRVLGLAQAWRYFRGRQVPERRFRMTGLYRWVRHPMLGGFLLLLWATPEMTAGRLLLATALGVYGFVAVRREERDLEREHGGLYGLYTSHVPMLIPGLAVRRERAVDPPWER